MAWAAAAAGVISTVGNIQAGNAAKRQGLQQQQELQYEAAQDRVNAVQAIASSQRTAEEQRRQGDLVQSRAIALAAASGGGVTDPSVVSLLSRNAGETAYRSAVALYQGDDQARTLNARADAALYSGEVAAQAGRDRQKAYMMKAFGDLLSAGGSMYNLFGGGIDVQQTPAPVFDATPNPVR